MGVKKIQYNVINMAVIFLTAALFIYGYRDIREIFRGENVLSVFILTVTVILVHAIKAGRLYLALYGSDIDFVTYLKIYCKVTPVSVLAPFKLGEFFRMYCYGKQLGNMLKGVVIILLDRFMDSIALVTAIILVWIINGGDITFLVYLLLIFLVFVLLMYIVFPGVYKFWKKYLLRAAASENRLAVLKMLEALNFIYREVEGVTKGRGIVLYFMSLIAWGVEIGSITLLTGMSGESDISRVISKYLISAMSGNPSVPLKRFVFVSVVLLLVLYLLIKAGKLFNQKRIHR